MRRWEQLFWKCERPWLSKRTGHTRNEDAGHLEGKRQARPAPKNLGARFGFAYGNLLSLFGQGLVDLKIGHFEFAEQIDQEIVIFRR
jgi:hypothetical protein